MRLLVTGRDGQLALCLADEASRSEVELVAMGRPTLDLERPETVYAAIKAHSPDVVINAAAYTGVDQAEEEAEAAFRINAEGASHVAAAAAAAGARLVHISTDYVFDGRSESPYAEEAPVAPLGVYGRSKLEGEARVRVAQPDHVILRTSWVYSRYGRNFLKTMMRLGQTQQTVKVVGDQRGTPTSAHDLARAILRMIGQWRDTPSLGLGETFHLAGTGVASWSEFAEAIFAECRRVGLPAADVVSIPTSDWPTRAARPANSALDGSKFRERFGFELPPWRDSTARVVAELAAGPWPQ